MDPSSSVKRRARWCRLIVVTLACVSGVGIACGDATGGALLNADAGDGSIVGCNTIAQLGDQVEIQALAPGATIVDTPGGTITDGTYVLVRMELVPKSGVAGPTGVILAQTIRISGASIAIVQSDGNGESRSLGTFTVGATGLTRSDSCVAAKGDASGDPVTTAAFAATTDALVLVTRTSTGVALIATYLRKSDA